MMRDADGVERFNIDWTIESRGKVRAGRLYELHEAEVQSAKQTIKNIAKRGDTITINVI